MAISENAGLCWLCDFEQQRLMMAERNVECEIQAVRLNMESLAGFLKEAEDDDKEQRSGITHRGMMLESVMGHLEILVEELRGRKFRTQRRYETLRCTHQ